MIRVALVDDQAMFRAGIAMVIDSQPDLTVVAQAGDGADAESMVREHRPDVVLMDVRMPRVDGAAATRRLVDALGDDCPKVAADVAAVRPVRGSGRTAAGCLSVVGRTMET